MCSQMLTLQVALFNLPLWFLWHHRTRAQGLSLVTGLSHCFLAMGTGCESSRDWGTWLCSVLHSYMWLDLKVSSLLSCNFCKFSVYIYIYIYIYYINVCVRLCVCRGEIKLHLVLQQDTLSTLLVCSYKLTLVRRNMYKAMEVIPRNPPDILPVSDWAISCHRSLAQLLLCIKVAEGCTIGQSSCGSLTLRFHGIHACVSPPSCDLCGISVGALTGSGAENAHLEEGRREYLLSL